MNNKNEEKFIETLKTLVNETPQKIPFFDGLDPDAVIPSFVPQKETIVRKRRDTVKRKRLDLGLTASAAASFVFVFLGLFNNDNEPVHAPAPEMAAMTDDAVDIGRNMDVEAAQPIQLAASADSLLPLFLACAIVSAAVFVILLLLRRKTSR